MTGATAGVEISSKKEKGGLPMRRLLALCLGALLLCGAAGAETFAVNAGENALLLTDAGEALTQWGEYAAASRISPPECPAERALFIAAPVLSALPEGVEAGDLAPYRLLNARGEALCDELYMNAQHLPEAGVVLVWQGQWAGVIDEDGAKLLPCAYGSVLPDGEGGFLVTPREYFNCDEDGYAISARLWRIDADGAAADTGLTVQPQFSAEFADGLAPMCVSTAEGWRYGYVNARGELVLPAEFDYAENFRDGCAVARTPGGLGLLRPDGSWALEPVYEDINWYWGGGEAFYALREDGVELIDRATLAVRAALPVAAKEYSYAYELDGAAIVVVADEELLAVDMEGRALFRGDTEEMTLSSSFTACEGVPDRLICTRGAWPEQESFLADLRLRPVSDAYRMIESGLWWKNGEGRFLVCDFEISEQAFDGETYAYPVASSYRYGVIDEDGAEVLPVAYNAIQYLSSERYWARRGETWMMLDEAGNVYFEVSEYMDLMD